MFDRRKYKNFALQQLKGRWFIPILITLVTFFVTGLFALPDMMKFFQTDEAFSLLTSDFHSFIEYWETYNQALSKTTSYASTIIQTVVEGIFTVAALNVYLKMARSPEPVTFSMFIEGLNSWWKAVKASLWQFLWVFIWSLLFVIPGIIKSIAYSMTYYLVSEYDDLPVTRALKISELITKGHKGELFVTYLSFLGWAVLSIITCGIGFLWLKPYTELTLINAYHALMDEAIEKGILKLEDLQ